MNRGLCLYKSLDFSGITQTDRDAALAIQLQQISPFASSGHFAVFQGDIAQIWLWDAAAQKTAALTLQAQRAYPLPETLLVKKPTEDGLYLRTCLTGYELQYWRNNALTLSKWWPHKPDEKAIKRFTTANDLAENEVEAPAQDAWLDKPWASPARVGTLGFAQVEQHCVLALLCVVSFFFAYYAVQHLQLWREMQNIEKEQTELERSIQPVLEARAAIVQDAETIKFITSLTPTPPMTVIFGEVLSLLKPNQLTLAGWQYQYPTLLIHIQRNQRVEQGALVQAFENSRLFSGVTIAEDTRNKTLALTLTVDPVRSQQNTTVP